MMSHPFSTTAPVAPTQPIFPGSIFLGDTRVPTIIERYRAAHTALSQCSDFSPNNPVINHMLSRLVEAASQGFSPAQERIVLNHPTVQSLYEKMLPLLSEAECAMERHFSVLLDNGTRDRFLYMQNYAELVAAEVKQLDLSAMREGQSIAFVGAGPLPLSAILMHEMTGFPVTCIDIDPVAVRLGRDFLRRSQLNDAVTYVKRDGAAYDFSSHPVIFVASLIDDKESVIAQIRKRTGPTEFAVRSVDGVHRLLYRPVCRETFLRLGIRFDRQTVANPSIINTTLFARLTPRLS